MGEKVRNGARLLAVAVCLLLFAPSALVWGSGFYTPDIGARTVGRGSAFIVGVDDLSAIYLNPAGLAYIKGTNLMLVNNFDIFHTQYQRTPIDPTVHNQNPMDIIQFLALSSDFGLKDFTFALGFFGPYGVAEEYPTHGPQRYQAVEIVRGQVYYMFGVGWKPWDWLRLGAAAGIGEFSENDKYAFSPFDDGLPQNDIIAKARIKQIGLPMYAAGFQLGPFNGFETGFSYQPPTDVLLKGKIIAPLPALYGAFTGYDVYRDNMTVSLKFPQIFRGGVRYHFTPQFDLEADAVWIGWSRFKYQKVDFEKEELIEDMNTRTGWKDAWNYRLGGDYEILPMFFVRAGGWYDDTATPPTFLEPGAIEMPRWSANVGVGYEWKGMTLDFAYSHIWMESAEVNENEVQDKGFGDARGKYSGDYEMFLLGLNMNFGKMANAFKKRNGVE